MGEGLGETILTCKQYLIIHSNEPFVVNKAGFRFPCLLITLFGKFCVLCHYLH